MQYFSENYICGNIFDVKECYDWCLISVTFNYKFPKTEIVSSLPGINSSIIGVPSNFFACLMAFEKFSELFFIIDTPRLEPSLLGFITNFEAFFKKSGRSDQS